MRKSIIITMVVAGGLALAAPNLCAQSAGAPYQAYPQPGQPNQFQQNPSNQTAPNFRASQIIGQPVRSQDGQQLGKVQDLVVNLQSDSVPCAIIESGGALGLGLIGQNKIAVPMSELRWSNQSRELVVMATKDQLQSANAQPTGQWVAVQQQGGLNGVNRFYGQPTFFSQSPYERQEMPGYNQGREPVRNPAEQGYQGQSGQGVVTTSQPGDQQLADQINNLVQQNVPNASGNIEVVLRNGIVTLRGRVPSEAQKQVLENQIKALPGVDRVQDSLIAGPE